MAANPQRERQPIPTFNRLPLVFLLSLPVSAALGWLLFLLTGS